MTSSSYFGQVVENDIEVQALLIPDVVLVKQYPEIVFVGKGVARATGKGFVDYVLYAPGIVLSFDAKGTHNKNKITFSSRRHQFDVMQEVSRKTGHPCFYLVYWFEHSQGTAHIISDANRFPIEAKRKAGDFSAQGDDWFIQIIYQIRRGTQ